MGVHNELSLGTSGDDTLIIGEEIMIHNKRPKSDY